MEIGKWDQHGLDEALLASKMSKDPSTKCGAYICDEHNRPVGKGMNGLPRGLSDDPERLNNREWKYAATIHAETNAILFADRNRLEGSTIYVTHPPCGQCAAKIIQVGIKRVVFNRANEAFLMRWGSAGVDLLREAGIQVDIVSESKCDGSDYC